MGHIDGICDGSTCGQKGSSLAVEHGAFCTAPAAATQESHSDAAIAQVRVDDDYQTACSSDAVHWPLLLAGVGILLAAHGCDGWDRLLAGTELQGRLPEGALRKFVTAMGLLAIAEGSTLLDP